jgi:hypothetical protein
VHTFFLDLLIIVGRPLKPITQPTDRFFDNIVVSFKDWRAPYSTKHAHGVSFDLEGRTFRIATAATRETWYIVMHPVAEAPAELLSGRRRRMRLERSSQFSALAVGRANVLATYIKKVFSNGELLGEGVEPSWRLSGPQSQRIAFNKWTRFQELFMQQWSLYIGQHTDDAFWREVQPAFHAHDYGANIEIEPAEQLEQLPKVTRLCPDDEESGTDAEISEEEQPSVARELGSQGSPSTESLHHVDSNSYTDDLYTSGLHQLRTELELKYALENIENVSYALAVNVNGLDGRSPLPTKPARCFLADRNAVSREYQAPREYTFYPLAFHPGYGNFTSPKPPAFLMDHLLSVLQENLSYRNLGNSVLRCGYFQAYSNIKRSIRHGPEDLLVTQGIATAALAIPRAEAATSGHKQGKQQRLLHRLTGSQTPDNPNSSKPFARERQRIESAIQEEEFAFRMEQVLSIQVSRLIGEQRSFSTVLSPIFQLMRFFLKEPHHYVPLLRSFDPEVFPRILGSYARVFELAVDNIHRKFEASGSQGLGVALAEGVAALDRLGSYCFTGLPRSLIGSVFTPLGTIDSIQEGAWPYINPQVLDLRGKGSLHFAKWPRDENGRPVLMHVASIAYHYGVEAAASRHCNVWFRELGGTTINGPAGAARLLEAIFRDVWIPEMVVFVTTQYHRAASKNSRSQPTDDATQHAPVDGSHEQQLVEQWSRSSEPFSWKYVGPPLIYRNSDY